MPQSSRTPPRLIEAFALPVALGARLLVLLDVELRVGDRAEDLARPRQLVARDVLLRVPELRAEQRPRALRVRLLDGDEEPEPRRLSFDGAVGEELRVIDDPGAAVDAERVVHAGNEKEERDPVVLEEVRERVGELVPDRKSTRLNSSHSSIS